jgi:hypothetical protein
VDEKKRVTPSDTILRVLPYHMMMGSAGALPHTEFYQATPLLHEECYPTEANSLTASCGKLSHVSSEETRKDGAPEIPGPDKSR